MAGDVKDADCAWGVGHDGCGVRVSLDGQLSQHRLGGGAHMSGVGVRGMVVLEWIWVSVVVPAGIAGATLGLAWLETRLLTATGPVTRPDPVNDPAPATSLPISHAALNLSLGTTP